MKYYTGVGSRQCPSEICKVFTEIAQILSEQDYVLRSGGADGADSAFEAGAGDKKDIYLPWKNFNGNTSLLFTPSEKAKALVETLHPGWHNLTRGGKLLHARNAHQVLGTRLDTPSDFVICWTTGGGITGGTATAIKLATRSNIPVYNLYNKEFKDWTAINIVELILEERDNYDSNAN